MRPTKERASHLLQQEGLQCGVQRLADVLQQDRGAGAACPSRSTRSPARASMARSQAAACPCSTDQRQRQPQCAGGPDIAPGSALGLGVAAASAGHLRVNAQRPAAAVRGDDGAVYRHRIVRQAHGMPLSHLNPTAARCSCLTLQSALQVGRRGPRARGACVSCCRPHLGGRCKGCVQVAGWGCWNAELLAAGEPGSHEGCAVGPCERAVVGDACGRQEGVAHEQVRLGLQAADNAGVNTGFGQKGGACGALSNMSTRGSEWQQCVRTSQGLRARVPAAPQTCAATSAPPRQERQ